MPNTLWIRDFFNWLRQVQMSHFRNRQIGGSGQYPFAYRTAHDFTGYLRRATGLDYADLMFSGAAPLDYNTEKFMSSCGFNIVQGFGMSETSAASIVNLTHAQRFSCIGQVIHGLEARIASDQDPEISKKIWTAKATAPATVSVVELEPPQAEPEKSTRQSTKGERLQAAHQYMSMESVDLSVVKRNSQQ